MFVMYILTVYVRMLFSKRAVQDEEVTLSVVPWR